MGEIFLQLARAAVQARGMDGAAFGSLGQRVHQVIEASTARARRRAADPLIEAGLPDVWHISFPSLHGLSPEP